MQADNQPLVFIVTPVYNGVEHLAEAVESVIAQTYTNWRYVIVDNCSKDGTTELADRLADRDDRVEVQHPEEFFGFIGNWNRAIGQTPQDAEYCMLFCADDVLYPEFLEKMVEIGEKDPRVGMLGCYRREGRQVSPQFTGHLDEITPGREMARRHMQREFRMFCCPSAMLYRAAVVRENLPFYPEGRVHADIAVCYEAMKEWGFGFSQRMLVYNRMHDDSMTAVLADAKGTIPLEDAMMTHEYGASFFEGRDLAHVIKENDRRYYRELARRMFLPGRGERMAYHRERWASIGKSFSRREYWMAALREATTRALDLHGHVLRLLVLLRMRRPRKPGVVPTSTELSHA